MLITDKIIQSTYKFRFKERMGTCFIAHIEERRYVITAKHLIEDINNHDIIQYYRNNQWIGWHVTLIGHSPNADISVLTDNTHANSNESLPILTGDGLAYSQDVYIVGFPGIIETENSEVQKINRDFPFPTVKKGIISYAELSSYLIIDIQGNPGFSGSPVVFLPHGKNGKNNHQIAGIVSSYKHEIQPVYSTELEALNDRSGNVPIGYYRSNPGFVKAYTIKHALELIENK